MDLTRPFIYFFSIGFVHALWGLMTWIMFAIPATAPIINYPGLMHARAMNEGFLISFATGFILTFFPRTTRTMGVQKSEFYPLIFCSILAGLTDWAALLGLLVLMLFCIKRIKSSPLPKLPPFVMAIFGGIIAGLIGNILKINSTQGWIELNFDYKPWLYEGVLLFWLIGVGSFLIPMITQSQWEPPFWSKKLIPVICGVITFGFILESFFHLETTGRMVRLASILFSAVFYWHIHQIPRKRGFLSWGIWFGLINVVFGYAVRVLFPAWGVHAIHIVYVMGYSLVTIMVATRVSIAHGNGNFQIEMTYKRTATVIACILLAGATRFSVVFMPERLVNHLAYASFTWIIGALIWQSMMFPIWRKNI